MVNLHSLIPNPLAGDQQYLRFYHKDLAGLDDTKLTDELWALRPLLWGLDSGDWLRERVKALEAEIRRRKFG
jgi:hypothetical protein